MRCSADLFCLIHVEEKMKKATRIMGAVLAIGVIVMFSNNATADTPNVKEGKWEITTTMEMPGMPMQMPPMVTTQCITKKDFIPESNPQPNADCTPLKMKVNGNTAKWSIKCKTDDGVMTGSGKVTYSGSTFAGEMKINQGGMTVTSKMKGKYIGKCD